MLTILATAEEGAEQLRDIGIDPYAIGGIAMGIFTVAMLLLLSFGKGREHT
jgi:hypothetical protein